MAVLDLSRQIHNAMSEGVLAVHNMNGDVLLQIEEEDVMWPADDHSHVLSSSDVMAFLGIKQCKRAFYDLIPILPAGLTSESILRDDDIVQWGQSYMLQQRTCPRCTLCHRPCERVGVHKLCSHRCFGTEGQALHLWRIYHGQRLRVFPEDVMDDELCQLCEELDIPDEVLQRVRSLATLPDEGLGRVRC